MPWEFALPNLLARDASDAARPAVPPMDDEAFAGFYERSARPLWAYLARTSGDPALAEDLMQESYVRFLCAAGRPSHLAEGEVVCRRYLFQIGTNLLRDHWRRPRPANLEEVPESAYARCGDQAQADRLMLLGPAMEQMRPRERQLLWLAHAEGYSHKEIAEVMGLGNASVRLLLFRARRKIARLLGEKREPGEMRGLGENRGLEEERGVDL
jgi:RNA polymerase sigma-70 factor, ECF subfamily